jgi:hypothetical protein
MVILAENLFRCPSPRKQIHDELDGDACALDHGLADEHLRVNADSIMPVHVVGSPISKRPRRRSNSRAEASMTPAYLTPISIDRRLAGVSVQLSVVSGWMRAGAASERGGGAAWGPGIDRTGGTDWSDRRASCATAGIDGGGAGGLLALGSDRRRSLRGCACDRQGRVVRVVTV